MTSEDAARRVEIRQRVDRRQYSLAMTTFDRDADVAYLLAALEHADQERDQLRAELAEAKRRGDVLGLALNGAGSTLTLAWNRAYWEPALFTPAWFVQHYDAWLERLANNRHEEYQLIDQAKQSEATLQTLRSALEQLAHEWDSRAFYDNHVSAYGQEMRKVLAAALASISSSPNTGW
jgi:hypothetical protein